MIYLLLTAVLWGFSYGINCQAMAFMTAPAMGFLFCAIGVVLFCPFAGHSSLRGLRVRFAAVGAVQMGFMYYFYQGAFAHLQSHHVALLSLSTPIYVGLFADCFERRAPWRRLLFAAAAVAACAFSLGGSITGSSLRGFLECQAANIFYALGQVLFGRMKLAHPNAVDRSAIFWMYVGAATPLALTLLLPAAPPPEVFHWAASQLAPLLFLGIVCSGMGNYLWNKGIGAVSAGTLLICNNLPMIFGLILGRLLFGESGSWPRQIFAAAVLLGLLWLDGKVGHGDSGDER